MSVWQAIRATDAQQHAEADRDRAGAAEMRAAEEAAIARAVNNFLQRDLLGQVDTDPRLQDEPGGEAGLTVREALDRAAAKIGGRFRDRPVVEAAIRMAIGRAYQSVKQPQLALKQYELALALRRAHLGPSHPDTLDSMSQTASRSSWVMDTQKAIALRQEVLDTRRATLGPDDRRTIAAMRDLGHAYQLGRRYQDSIRLGEGLLEKARAVCGPHDDLTLDVMHNLAMNYGRVGRNADSLALHEELLNALEVKDGPDAASAIWPRMTFAQECQRAGKLDRADQLLQKALAVIQKQESSRHWRATRARVLGWLALSQCLRNKCADAEPLVRETVAIHEKERNQDPGRYYWVSLLGETLRGQRKFEEAEPLLLRGYEGMKLGEAVHHVEPRLIREAAERLIHFYEDTGKPDKVGEWQAILAATPPPK